MIIWKPQPRQAAFMRRTEYEALYGGAAGGGKSDALLCEALRQIDKPNYRALLLRKTYPQLSELVDRSQTLYAAAVPAADYNVSRHVWTFPSGARVTFGSMQHPGDRISYQGRRFDFIGFDELTQFTWEEYSYMFSRNRPSGPGTRVYMRATANPGGIGHAWVRERFIDPAPPMSTVTTSMCVALPGGGTKNMKRDRVFVPSTVFDNPALLSCHPEYLAALGMLPENDRKALLYGSWDAFEGQVFREWRNDAAHRIDGRYTHVIAPRRVPEGQIIYRGFDFGYARPFAVGWYAADERGGLTHVRELYGWGGAPNVGSRSSVADIARGILRAEREDENIAGHPVIGIADPSIFDESRGESVAGMLAREGVFFRRGDNARLAGKMQVHRRLAFDGGGRPQLQVFETCPHFIRTLPALVYDANRVEDVDTAAEDHIYDALRYVCMARPISPPPPPPPTRDEDVLFFDV